MFDIQMKSTKAGVNRTIKLHAATKRKLADVDIVCEQLGVACADLSEPCERIRNDIAAILTASLMAPADDATEAQLNEIATRPPAPRPNPQLRL